MLKLMVCIIILVAVCTAQEHLTCTRTANVSTQPSTQTPQGALQGSPGKRGPKGQTGSRGYPGQKGEPGIPDNHQINLLQNQIDFLSEKVETLKNQSRKNQLKQQVDSLSGEVEVLKNQSKELNSLVQEVEALKNQSRENRQLLGLIGKESYLYIHPYVYVYRITPGRQSWQRSRQYCQNWGGDLAVHGVKTMENRKKLIENLSVIPWMWIGANDIGSEGNWIWVDGERASGSELIWARPAREQPDGGDNHDCVHLFGRHDGVYAGFAGDYACSHVDHGLCEKQI